MMFIDRYSSASAQLRPLQVYCSSIILLATFSLDRILALLGWAHLCHRGTGRAGGGGSTKHDRVFRVAFAQHECMTSFLSP
jgi:hypothetical protein